MGSSSIMTPGMQQVRRVADLVKDRTNGLSVEFLVEEHGSVRNASAAARAFQTAFSSLRAREHRKAQRRAGESANLRDSDIEGKYDNMSALKRELPNGLGFEVRLVTTTAISLGMRVRDLDTGELVPQVDPQQLRWDAINAVMARAFHAAQAQRRKMTDPLEPHDVEWLRVNFPKEGEYFYESHGLTAPWVQKEMEVEIEIDDLDIVEGDMFKEGDSNAHE